MQTGTSNSDGKYIQVFVLQNMYKKSPDTHNALQWLYYRHCEYQLLDN